MKGNKQKGNRQVEDTDLEKKRNNRQRTLARKQKKDLTIADRLTLSALERIKDVPFEDSHGEFMVKMHTPLRSEFDEIVRLQEELKSGDQKRMEKASEEFFRMLDALCVDSSLNYEFWKTGAYDPMDMIRLMDALTTEMIEKVAEAQSFRGE